MDNLMRVSILGDSLSTFEGYNPDGWAVFYDAEKQAVNGLRSVADTWWAQVIRGIPASLCVNASYSGSRASGRAFPSAWTDGRLTALRTESCSPDLILICIGFNDYGYRVPPRCHKPGWTPGTDPRFFEDAYLILLRKITAMYPRARVVCATLLAPRRKGDPDWDFEFRFGYDLDEFNDVIRGAARSCGCFLADVAASGVRYEALDSAHPTADGHRTIAELWLACLRENGALA